MSRSDDRNECKIWIGQLLQFAKCRFCFVGVVRFFCKGELLSLIGFLGLDHIKQMSQRVTLGTNTETFRDDVHPIHGATDCAVLALNAGCLESFDDFSTDYLREIAVF